jgi:Ca2+/Na+ antiporter
MSPAVETALAFILFLPSFVILGALYCMFPRQPRHARRLLADLAVLLVAGMLSIVAMRWGFAVVAGEGRIWQQIVATLLAYGVFLALLTFAVFLRARLLRPR